jgi:hypothetical protein
MKKNLLICFVFTVVLSHATAQVSKSDFTRNINLLTTFINQKNSNGEANVYGMLDGMMSNQINYLNSDINPLTKKYSADTLKASADLKSARSAPDPNSPQMIAARNEAKQAALELNMINQYKNNLAADRALFTNIQPLKRNIAANETTLINYLNQFAATLQ